MISKQAPPGAISKQARPGAANRCRRNYPLERRERARQAVITRPAPIRAVLTTSAEGTRPATKQNATEADANGMSSFSPGGLAAASSSRTRQVTGARARAETVLGRLAAP